VKILNWFPQARLGLWNFWDQQSRMVFGCDPATACGVLFSDVLDLSKGHVSIACALIDDHSQITKLLSSSAFDADPRMFFRVLVFLLDEYTERICETYKLIGERSPKQPEIISIWANKYAKHKLRLFVYHHPIHVFAEANPVMHASLESGGVRGGYCLRSGIVPENLFAITEKWLKQTKQPDSSQTNAEEVPAIVVPPLQSFLDPALRHAKGLIDAAKQKPEELKKYQSEYHTPIFGPEDEVIRLFKLLESSIPEGQ